MIKLILDSTSEITENEAKKYDIDIIHMKVVFDGEEFIVGKNLSNSEFYQKLKVCQNLPKTTQINKIEFIEAINKVLDNGDEAFVMCLPIELSGSYNNLCQAKEEINSDKVEVFDARMVTFGFRVLVEEAVKLIKSGVTLQELKSKMLELVEKVRLYAVIDNVKYLIKGGRLSVAKGVAATALNIKPIVTVTGGNVVMVTKSLGFAQGVKCILKLIKNIDSDKTIFFGHSENFERLNKLKEAIKINFNVESDNVCDIGSIIGTHVGPNCVGIAYFEK